MLGSGMYVCSGRAASPRRDGRPYARGVAAAGGCHTAHNASVCSLQAGRPTLAHGHAHAHTHTHESGVAGVSGVAWRLADRGGGACCAPLRSHPVPVIHTPSLPLLRPTPPITSNGPNPANLLVTRSCSWLTPVRQKQVQRWGRCSCPNSVTSPVQVGRAAILRREDGSRN